VQITGAPGAILQQYGGIRDLILVGTRRDPAVSPSQFLGLRLADGEITDTFTGGGTPFRELGAVSGTPAVDYGNQRVYFASRRRGSGHTVWALDVGVSSLTFAWSLDPGGEFDTSPVIHNGRIYLGDTAGTIYSINSTTPGPPGSPPADVTMSTGDGPVKAYLFPDRSNENLIFARTRRCGASAHPGDRPAVDVDDRQPQPSAILYWRGSNLVYVGSRNGRLYELDFTAADTGRRRRTRARPRRRQGQVGAPALDNGVSHPKSRRASSS
jgi:outer membrane protein assembly factor BamB